MRKRARESLEALQKSKAKKPVRLGAGTAVPWPYNGGRVGLDRLKRVRLFVCGGQVRWERVGGRFFVPEDAYYPPAGAVVE